MSKFLYLIGAAILWLLLSGCAVTLKTGQIDVTAKSIPPGIADYSLSLPGIDSTVMIDPWTGIRFAVDAVGDVVALIVPSQP